MQNSFVAIVVISIAVLKYCLFVLQCDLVIVGFNLLNWTIEKIVIKSNSCIMLPWT